ncbi:glutathione S-transferase N-terminal domain-containing protein [Halomonas shantousis]
MSLTLFLTRTSPYARVARIAALEKKLGERLVLHWVDPWQDDPALLAVSPVAKVPVLVLKDGTAITETLLITRMLDTVGPGPALFPEAELPQVLKFAGLGQGLLDAAFQTVIARKHDGAATDASALGRRRLAAIERLLITLEAELAPRHRYADDAHLTLDDIMLAVALDYVSFRLGELDWKMRFPALSAWQDARLSRESFRLTSFE